MCRSPSPRAHLGRRWTRSTTSDHGSTAVELVVVVPALMVALLFIVYAGRLTQANTRVHQAADHAARSAAMTSRRMMTAKAEAAVAASMEDARCAQHNVTVSVDTGAVTATVTCTIDRSDLAPLAPGVQTVTASSTEVIDVRRGG